MVLKETLLFTYRFFHDKMHGLREGLYLFIYQFIILYLKIQHLFFS
ncbi:hypothetical protein NY10_190 [Carnobacterium antarcticum]|nr:hypothetical protein NY10_190 [Carnobacterium sp. CP1]